jgi:hypothetical protein
MKWVWMAIGAAVISAPAYGFGFYMGDAHRKDKIAAQQASGQIQIYKDGRQIDEKVLSADDVGLCDMLGGC